MRKQNSSPPNRAWSSFDSSARTETRCAPGRCRSSERTCSRSSCATRSMMRSPTAWPSASLYHLKPVISTRPTAHQRPRCSSARNDSSCSVKRAKFISFVFGSRCDLSVRSATSCSK